MPKQDVPVVKVSTLVSHSKLDAAYENWWSEDKNLAYTLFWKFLGLRGYPNPNDCGVNHKGELQYTLSHDAAHKIEMLLGPHYRTVIKAWKVKHAGDN